MPATATSSSKDANECSRPPPVVRLAGGDDEYVTLPPPLPSNPFDVIYLLKVETASRSHWRDVALAYFRESEWDSGITVLQQAVSDDVDAILHATHDPQDPNACSRMDLLAALAGAHVMDAAAESDPDKRREKLANAADVCSRADKIDLDHPNIWASRGWMEFHSGKTGAANWFENAKDKKVVAGAMGLVVLELNRVRGENKRDAVELLCKALQSKVCPGGIWTGLGYALFRDGKLRSARSVARRAVRAVGKVKSEKLEALYLLALLESAEKLHRSPVQMVAALREAYLHCGGDKDPRVLALIAESHFLGGDFESAERFGKLAVDICEQNRGKAAVGGVQHKIHINMRCAALFQLARAQHQLGKADQAIRGFDEVKKLVTSGDVGVVKINPGMWLRLGMLKLSTDKKEDESEAQECLEKALKESNDRCNPASRALGVLLGRRVLHALKKGKPRGGEMYHRALSLLKRGMENAEGEEDVPAQLVYAGLVEEFHPKDAVDAYRKAIKVMKERNVDIEPELWSNLSSLLVRLGEIDEAEDALKNAAQDMLADKTTGEYNRGRIAEMKGDTKRAEEIYLSLSKEHPHHYEALVRLAVMYMDNEEKADTAESYLKEAMQYQHTKGFAAVFLSSMFTRRKKFKQAQEILEANRTESEYLTLCFASFMHRFLDSRDKERRSRFLLNHIGAPLLSILKRNKRNASAANGVGVFFAESGMYGEAHDAFIAAGAGQGAAKISKVNLANTQLQLGHRVISDSARVTGRPSHKAKSQARALFEQADKLHRDALGQTPLSADKESLHAHCELLLYIAWGKFENFEFAEAAELLTKLLHLTPTSAVVWFNLGQALLEAAIYRLAKGSTLLREIQLAKDEYEGSRNALLKCLKLLKNEIDPLTRTKLDPKLVQHMERFVRQQAKSHEVKLRNALLEAEDREKKRLASMKEVEERKRKLLEEQQKVDEARRKKEEELRLAFEESLRKKEEYEQRERLNKEQEEEVEYEEGGEENKEASGKKPRSKRKKRDGAGTEEKPAKKARKQRKLVKKKEQESDGSGSEYSDVNDAIMDDVDPEEDSAGAKGDDKPVKRKKISADEEDNDSEN